MRSRLIWILGGTVAIGVLSLIAAALPTPVKLLVLFLVGFGYLGGELLRWLADECGITLRMGHVIAGSIMIAAGGVGVGWLSYQQFYRARQALAAKSERMMALNLLGQMATNDPELAADFEEQQRVYAPLFVDYLSHRVSPLGAWPPPWPLVFWGSEIGLASLVGGWRLRTQSLPRSDRNPKNEKTL